MMIKRFGILALSVLMYVFGTEPDSQQPTTQVFNQQLSSHLGSLYAHEPIYILPYYHSFSPTYDKNIATETKFQFSFRIPMFAVGEHNKFFFAYTQTAFFQNYNKLDSRPFRDTDYAPELYWSYDGINALCVSCSLVISMFQMVSALCDPAHKISFCLGCVCNMTRLGG